MTATDINWHSFGSKVKTLPTGEYAVSTRGWLHVVIMQVLFAGLFLSIPLFHMAANDGIRLSIVTVLAAIGLLAAALALCARLTLVSTYVFDFEKKTVTLKQISLGREMNDVVVGSGQLEAIVMDATVPTGLKTKYRYGLLLIAKDGQRFSLVPASHDTHSTVARDGERLSELLGIPFFKGERDQFPALSFEEGELRVRFYDGPKFVYGSRQNGWASFLPRVFQGPNRTIHLVGRPTLGPLAKGFLLYAVLNALTTLLMGLVPGTLQTMGMFGGSGLYLARWHLLGLALFLYYLFGDECVVDLDKRTFTHEYRFLGYKIRSSSFEFDDLDSVGVQCHEKVERDEKTRRVRREYSYGLSVFTNDGREFEVFPCNRISYAETKADGRYLADLLESGFLEGAPGRKIYASMTESGPEFQTADFPFITKEKLIMAAFLLIGFLSLFSWR